MHVYLKILILRIHPQSKLHKLTYRLSMQDIKEGKGAFTLYYGPNRYQEMRKLKVNKFDKNVHLGWALFAWVAKYLIITTL